MTLLIIGIIAAFLIVFFFGVLGALGIAIAVVVLAVAGAGIWAAAFIAAGVLGFIFLGFVRIFAPNIYAIVKEQEANRRRSEALRRRRG